MRPVFVGALALFAAFLLPAAVMIVIYAVGSLTAPGISDDGYVWVRIGNFSLITLSITASHVLILGLPAFLILLWLDKVRWWSAIFVGFVLACLPVALWAWPLRFGGLSSSSSSWNGERMVATMIDGVPTLAGWLQYFQGVGFMGLFGAIGGLAFWATWRGMRSNYALERSVKALAMGAAGAPEDFAPAAPGTGVPRPAQRGR